MRILLPAAAIMAALLASTPQAQAQASAIIRQTLQSVEAPDPAHVVAMYLVTIAPQSTVARHIHPGVEMGYLLSGGGTLTIQGSPERTLKPGDSWAIPAGVSHTLHNTGDAPEQLVVTYVVQKDKPLSAPAP